MLFFLLSFSLFLTSKIRCKTTVGSVQLKARDGQNELYCMYCRSQFVKIKGKKECVCAPNDGLVDSHFQCAPVGTPCGRMNKSKWYTRFFFSASLLPYTHTNTRVFDRHNNAGIAEISDIINEEVWGWWALVLNCYAMMDHDCEIGWSIFICVGVLLGVCGIRGGRN